MLKSDEMIEETTFRKGEKDMKEVIPILTRAFVSAARLATIYPGGERSEKWQMTNFYQLCINAEKSILGSSTAVRYKVKRTNGKKKTAQEKSELEWYEILAELEDGKKARLEWDGGKVILELLSSDKEQLEWMKTQ